MLERGWGLIIRLLLRLLRWLVGLHVWVDVLEDGGLLLLWGEVLSLLIVDWLLKLGGSLGVHRLLIKSARGHLRNLISLLQKPRKVLVLKMLNVMLRKGLQIFLL